MIQKIAWNRVELSILLAIIGIIVQAPMFTVIIQLVTAVIIIIQPFYGLPPDIAIIDPFLALLEAVRVKGEVTL